jgi:ubiquinone biosynthesis protein
MEAAKLVGTLPRRVNKILEKLAWNDLKLIVENRVNDHLVHNVNKMVNRVTLAVMASGLFVGSSILLSFGTEMLKVIPSLRWLASGMLWGSSAVSVYVIWRVIRSKRA